MNPLKNNLPPQVLKAIEEERFVLFFGAGVSQNAGLPSAKELTNLLSDELRRDLISNSNLQSKVAELDESRNDLAKVAQLYNDFYGGRRAYEKVAEELAIREDKARLNILQPITELPKIRDILTTNYDTLIERAFPRTDFRVIHRSTDLRQPKSPKLSIVKLHGTYLDTDSMVLTKSDYETYYKKHGALIDLTKTLLRQKTLIVVGYSLEDMNFGMIYEEAIAEEDVLNFFVSLDKSLYQDLRWTKRGFHHIALSAEDFFELLKAEYARLHYFEDTASFPDPGRISSPTEPLNNPFVLYDTVVPGL